MLFSVLTLYFRSVPAKPLNDNSLDESSVTASYEIPVVPCRAYDTTQIELLVVNTIACYYLSFHSLIVMFLQSHQMTIFFMSLR